MQPSPICDVLCIIMHHHWWRLEVTKSTQGAGGGKRLRDENRKRDKLSKPHFESKFRMLIIVFLFTFHMALSSPLFHKAPVISAEYRLVVHQSVHEVLIRDSKQGRKTKEDSEGEKERERGQYSAE